MGAIDSAKKKPLYLYKLPLAHQKNGDNNTFALSLTRL